MNSRTTPVLGPPRARPAVVALSVLVALAALALAAVAVRDLVVDRGWADGSPWLPAVAGHLDGRTLDTATVVLAGAVALLGLLLVVAALLPGRRTHVRAAGAAQEAELWVGPRVAAAAALRAADRTEGVVAARVARASRRRVALEVTGRDAAAVSAARDSATGAVTDVPGVQVRVSGTTGADS